MLNNQWLFQLLEFVDDDKENGVTSKTLDYANNLIHQLDDLHSVKMYQKDIDILISLMNISNTDYVLFWLSVLAYYTKCESFFVYLAQYAFAYRKNYNIETQFYIYSQICAMTFLKNYSLENHFDLKYDDWLFEIVSYYREELKDYLYPIENHQRNNNLVFFISNQVLGSNHSPTIFALEWCKFLIEHGKNVMLINTAELLSQRGSIPFSATKANYVDSYSEVSYIDYEGIRVAFFQCPQTMPDINIIQILLNIVRDEKPGYILSIGDIIFSDLADKIIPVYSIGLSANLPRRYTKYLSLYRDLTDLEKCWMEKSAYKADSLINTCFAVNIPIQSTHLSREEIGIPIDSFCLAIVGNRLDYDLDEDFLNVLSDVLVNRNIFICFIGDFNYEKIRCKNPVFEKKTTRIPFVKDLLSILELSDLYVNPKRLGGGTSAVYAMSLGKPVVSLDYGDVYLNCGKAFCVDSFKAMMDSIIKYYTDSTYYESMSVLAKQRVEKVANVNSIMMMQIDEIEHREELNI